MKEKRVRIFLLRRWYMVGGAALAMAAVIFYVVNYPASVSTAASSRHDRLDEMGNTWWAGSKAYSA